MHNLYHLHLKIVCGLMEAPKLRKKMLQKNIWKNLDGWDNGKIINNYVLNMEEIHIINGLKNS